MELTITIDPPPANLPWSAVAQATVTGPGGEGSRILPTNGSLVEFLEGVRNASLAMGVKLTIVNNGRKP